MHAKPDLRVVLEWMIARSGSVIANVWRPVIDRRNDTLRHFRTLLARWEGADARLWELSTGHPTLTVLLWRESDPGCLKISCLDPQRIEAPASWPASKIRVVKSGQGFDVLDDTAAVRISACHVELAEYPKKPWSA